MPFSKNENAPFFLELTRTKKVLSWINAIYAGNKYPCGSMFKILGRRTFFELAVYNCPFGISSPFSKLRSW